MKIWNNFVWHCINWKDLTFEWLRTSYRERKQNFLLWIHFGFCFFFSVFISFSISTGTLFLAPTVFLLLPSGGSAPILKLQLHQLHLTATSLLSLFKYQYVLAIAWEFIWKRMHFRGCFRVVGRVQSAPRRGCRLRRIAAERRYSVKLHTISNQRFRLPFQIKSTRKHTPPQ